MFDFFYGDRDAVQENPEGFLLFVKHLLPRWANGIPDSECLGIFRASNIERGEGRVFAESGVGASTLALVLSAILSGKHAYSWDTNASKGHFLRSVMSEAIAQPLGVNVHDFWTFVGMSASDPFVGFPIVAERGQIASFAFLDSWHTQENLLAEVKSLAPSMQEGSVIGIDDAHYRCRSVNYSYINLQRAKIGMSPLEEPPENIGETFGVTVRNELAAHFDDVTPLVVVQDEELQEDAHEAYFSDDRRVFASFGMEDDSSFCQRFQVWRLGKPRL